MKYIKIAIILLIILNIITLMNISMADDFDEENDEDLESIEVNIDNSNIPQINSKAAIIYDRSSKKVLYGKNETEKRAMASTTKIMTAIVVLEKGNLTDVVEVSKKAAGTGGSRLGLQTGDKITVHDLLYGLMMRSGNDAAVALAEYMSGDVEKFADEMNKKAEELNLENTQFVTPHGLDSQNHYTTCLELAKIADYAMNIKEFREIVGAKNYTIKINGQNMNLNNTNELLRLFRWSIWSKNRVY